MSRLLSVLSLILWAISVGYGQDTGLAAKYPSDVGIGRDPAVLFHDDFEVGRIGGALGRGPAAFEPCRH